MTIKETAGRLLLYFYQLHRTVPTSMPKRQLGFIDKPNGSVSLTSDKQWLSKDLLDINSNPNDILNAYIFIIEKGYVKSRIKRAQGKQIYMGIYVTSSGVDVVEGIENGREGKNDFTKLFNIGIPSNSKVNDVIKSNLSKLLENN